MNISTENILVALPEQTVARLMNLRRFPSERVADIVKRLTVSVSDGPNAKGRDETSINLSGGRGRYVLYQRHLTLTDMGPFSHSD